MSKLPYQVYDNTLDELEESVNNLSRNAAEWVEMSITTFPTCSSEKLLTNSFNCLKTIEFNVDKMKTSISNCLNKAGDFQEVNKCLATMKDDTELLKNKIGKGYACSSISKCQEGGKEIIKPKKKTEYCLSHVGNDVTQKCLSKIKNGSLFKMTKAQINDYIGSTALKNTKIKKKKKRKSKK